uniref:ARAD1A14234p n=1 Tax=Blastobotrys adeninivorans TaxID=409370 RepID=A0A060SXN7_BLAAD
MTASLANVHHSDGLQEEVTDDWGYISLTGADEALDFIEPYESLPGRSCRLFAISNLHNVYVSAGSKGITAGKLSELRENASQGQSPQGEWFEYPLTIRHFEFSSDEKNLAIVADDENGSVSFFSVEDFTSSGTVGEPISTVQSKSVRDIQARPTNPYEYAVLHDDGDLCILNSKTGQFKFLEKNISAMSWATRGKTLLVGRRSNGCIAQYRAEGELTVSVAKPSWLPGTVYPVSLNWLDDKRFIAVYAEPAKEGEDDEERSVSAFLVEKDAHNNAVWSQIESPCTPAMEPDTSREDWWMSTVLRHWVGEHQILVNLVSAVSPDITLVSAKASFLIKDDTEKAGLPFTDDDTLPIGVALDISSTTEVANPIQGLEKSSALPILWILNNEGNLSAWHMVYKPGLRDGTVSLANAMAEFKKKLPAPLSSNIKPFLTSDIKPKTQTVKEDGKEGSSAAKPEAEPKGPPTVKPEQPKETIADKDYEAAVSKEPEQSKEPTVDKDSEPASKESEQSKEPISSKDSEPAVAKEPQQQKKPELTKSKWADDTKEPEGSTSEEQKESIEAEGSKGPAEPVSEKSKEAKEPRAIEEPKESPSLPTSRFATPVGFGSKSSMFGTGQSGEKSSDMGMGAFGNALMSSTNETPSSLPIEESDEEDSEASRADDSSSDEEATPRRSRAGPGAFGKNEQNKGVGFQSTSGSQPSPSTVPAFGQSGFGASPSFSSFKTSGTTSGFGAFAKQPAFGSSGFSTTSKEPEKEQGSAAPTSGFGAFAKQPAFGSSGFLTTDKGSEKEQGSAAPTGGFGAFANKPAFGSSGFLTTDKDSKKEQGSAAPTSGFGAFANKPAFGASGSGFGQFAQKSPFGSSTTNIFADKTDSKEEPDSKANESSTQTGFAQFAQKPAFGSSSTNIFAEKTDSKESKEEPESKSDEPSSKTTFGFGSQSPASGFGQAAQKPAFGSSDTNIFASKTDSNEPREESEPKPDESSSRNTFGFGSKSPASGFGQVTQKSPFGSQSTNIFANKADSKESKEEPESKSDESSSKTTFGFGSQSPASGFGQFGQKPFGSSNTSIFAGKTDSKEEAESKLEESSAQKGFGFQVSQPPTSGFSFGSSSTTFGKTDSKGELKSKSDKSSVQPVVDTDKEPVVADSTVTSQINLNKFQLSSGAVGTAAPTDDASKTPIEKSQQPIEDEEGDKEQTPVDSGLASGIDVKSESEEEASEASVESPEEEMSEEDLGEELYESEEDDEDEYGEILESTEVDLELKDLSEQTSAPEMPDYLPIDDPLPQEVREYYPSEFDIMYLETNAMFRINNTNIAFLQRYCDWHRNDRGTAHDINDVMKLDEWRLCEGTTVEYLADTLQASAESLNSELTSLRDQLVERHQNLTSSALHLARIQELIKYKKGEYSQRSQELRSLPVNAVELQRELRKRLSTAQESLSKVESDLTLLKTQLTQNGGARAPSFNDILSGINMLTARAERRYQEVRELHEQLRPDSSQAGGANTPKKSLATPSKVADRENAVNEVDFFGQLAVDRFKMSVGDLLKNRSADRVLSNQLPKEANYD